MENPGFGEHGTNVRSKTLPRQRPTLAAPIEPFEQQAGGSVEVRCQTAAIAANAVILNVTAHMPDKEGQHGIAAFRAQTPQVRIQQLELLVHPLGIGFAPDHETPPPTPPNVVGKAEEAKGPFCVWPDN